MRFILCTFSHTEAIYLSHIKLFCVQNLLFIIKMYITCLGFEDSFIEIFAKIFPQIKRILESRSEMKQNTLCLCLIFLSEGGGSSVRTLFYVIQPIGMLKGALS